MRVPAILAALASLLVPAPLQAEMSAADRCPVPASLSTPSRHLDHLGAALRADRPVEILAVGSATTNGQDGSASSAYPVRMLDALNAALPQARFTLTVRGGTGLTAAEMLPLIEAELKRGPMPLVLWQTGTVEAARGLPPAQLRAALDAGAAVVHAAGSDLVLIDPPFSHLLRSKVDVEPYQRALADATTLPGTALFPRSELMRAWAMAGRLDLEGTPKPERQAMLAALHECVGTALAQFLLNGAKPI